MKTVSTQELVEILMPEEGRIQMVAGDPGEGKGYLIAKMMLDDLRAGIPVYSSMPLMFDGHDERENWFQLLVSLVLPWRSLFVNIKKENFHLIKHRNLNAKELKEIYAGNLYLDEGQFILPSGFADRDEDKIELVSLTRHMYRKIVIVSQRFNAVNVNARGLVHQYFLCEKLLEWPFILFRVSEYRKLKGGEVDEERRAGRPRLEIGSRRIFNAYDTHYWGEGKKIALEVEGYLLSYFERCKALVQVVARGIRRQADPEATAQRPLKSLQVDHQSGGIRKVSITRLDI